jgi:FixJ family two-component response regulator
MSASNMLWRRKATTVTCADGATGAMPAGGKPWFIPRAKFRQPSAGNATGQCPPGKSGLDLQRELAATNRELPIIFITGHGDISMTVQAMKGGAIEFLTKPFRDQELLDVIQLGLSRDRHRRENEKGLATLRERFGSLSPRERDIMIQVARSRLSKQIAGDIGIAEATVKVHRSRVMRKMKARSLPELGRMADKLKLVPEDPQRA